MKTNKKKTHKEAVKKAYWSPVKKTQPKAKKSFWYMATGGRMK